MLQGQRGKASRLGSVSSGLDVTAASWSGAVRTRLYVRDGVDWVTVELMRWHGSGTERELYSGPVGRPELAVRDDAQAGRVIRSGDTCASCSAGEMRR